MNTIHAIRPPDVELNTIRSSDDPMVIENYLTDESTAIIGEAERVLYPTTEAEVAAVLRDCYGSGTAVSISGGGTGLTCSRVPLGGVVLSTERLIAPVAKESGTGERIISDGKYTLFLNDEEFYAVAPPAIMLQELSALLAAEGLLYPPNPTETTAFLGGTVACNASGGRTFQYGATRVWVQRLRVALSCGDILDIKRGEVFSDENGQFEIRLSCGETLCVQLPSYQTPAVKDASGYFVDPDSTDLIDLFIGCEGTLGVVTQVRIGLLPLPPDIFACTGYFPSIEAAIEFVRAARNATHDAASPIDALAIEYFDPHALRMLRQTYPNIPENAGAAIYFEQAIASDEDEILGEWLELLEEHGCIEDWSGFSDKDKTEMVDIRHAVPELCHQAVRQAGTHKVATDVAVPDHALDEIMAAYQEIGEASGVQYVLFGHIGNNHLHWDALPANEEELAASQKAFLALSRKGVELGGTISAEHGVGKKAFEEDGQTRPYLYLMYGETGLREIARTKHQLDPRNILNRGNIVPASYLDEL